MGCTSSSQKTSNQPNNKPTNQPTTLSSLEVFFEKLENNNNLLKCNINTLTWTKFASLKAKIGKEPLASAIAVFPKKCPNPLVVKELGFEFLLNEDLKNEVGDELQNLLFGGTVGIVNLEEFSDPLHYYDNIEDAKQMVTGVFKNCLPTQKVTWSDNAWQTDASLTDLAFCGLGQYYLRACDAKDIKIFGSDGDYEYKIDLLSWAKYDVRKEFENYGITAYFDEKRNPKLFVHNGKIVRKSNPYYRHTAFIFRSALITAITIKEHLVMVHWIVSNGALVSSMKFLGEDHPIRRLLRCHTYGTSAVNLSSTTVLAPYEGLAGRTFGFTKSSWSTMIADQIAQCKYQSIEEQYAESKLPLDELQSFPYYKDGIDFWNINKQYVTTFIKMFYADDEEVISDAELVSYWNGLRTYHNSSNYNLGALTKENLIKHLTYVIFSVTGQHTYLGSVCEYLLSPEALMPKVRKGVNVVQADIQTHLQALCIISLTTGKMPMLITDWSYLYDYKELKRNQIKYDAVLANLKQWQHNLTIQSELIQTRNATKTKPFYAFSPVDMESSVSV